MNKSLNKFKDLFTKLLIAFQNNKNILTNIHLEFCLFNFNGCGEIGRRARFRS